MKLISDILMKTAIYIFMLAMRHSKSEIRTNYIIITATVSDSQNHYKKIGIKMEILLILMTIFQHTINKKDLFKNEQVFFILFKFCNRYTVFALAVFAEAVF